MNNDAIEAAWTELTAPQNETVTSKWYFKKGFEAATKAALGSRVVLPPDDVCKAKIKELVYEWRSDNLPEALIDSHAKLLIGGWNLHKDAIKLIPLTAEQVDSLLPLPAQEGHHEFMLAAANTDCGDETDEWLRCLEYLRESIKKRLGGV